MDNCPEKLNLARPSLSYWQVHKSFWIGVILYSLHPGLVLSSLLSRMEPRYYSRGAFTHLCPNHKSFSKVPGNISRPLTLLRAKLCGKSSWVLSTFILSQVVKWYILNCELLSHYLTEHVFMFRIVCQRGSQVVTSSRRKTQKTRSKVEGGL